jgi:hypothetical protein
VPSIATFHGAIYLKVIVVMLPPLPALLVALVSLVTHVDQDANTTGALNRPVACTTTTSGAAVIAVVALGYQL